MAGCGASDKLILILNAFRSILKNQLLFASVSTLKITAMHITTTNNPDKADDDVISAGLQSYNSQYSSGSFELLSIYSRTNDNVIVGGLIGVTYGNWLHIHEFWVSEKHRGKSFGSSILNAAEAEAIRRGCIGVTLDTYSFQSLEFYLARGYEEFGSLCGYANKFDRHYLQKRLEQIE